MRTEVRRPLSPVERWFWIADQISPLNVIARVRVTGSPTGYFLATVSTSHDELFWNFIYSDGVVSHGSAQRFADGCLNTLFRAIA